MAENEEIAVTVEEEPRPGMTKTTLAVIVLSVVLSLVLVAMVVGVLGLINGLFGTIPAGHPRAGWGPIAAVAESQGGPIVRFERTDR